MDNIENMDEESISDIAAVTAGADADNVAAGAVAAAAAADATSAADAEANTAGLPDSTFSNEFSLDDINEDELLFENAAFGRMLDFQFYRLFRSSFLDYSSPLHETCYKSLSNYYKTESFLQFGVVEFPYCHRTSSNIENYPCPSPAECPFYLLEGMDRTLRFLKWADRLLRPARLARIIETMNEVERSLQQFRLQSGIFERYIKILNNRDNLFSSLESSLLECESSSSEDSSINGFSDFEEPELNSPRSLAASPLLSAAHSPTDSPEFINGHSPDHE